MRPTSSCSREFRRLLLRRHRPILAIKREEALALDGDWGLHPALKDSLYPLWQSKQIAFVPFAGTDDVSRSHFETQDTIELGQPVQGSRNYRSGFLARTATVLSGDKPIAFTNDLPLSFRGTTLVPNIALTFTGKPGVAGKNADLIQSMYQGQDLAPAVAQGFQVQNQVYQAISQEMQAANRDAVSPKGFELSAQRIGILMRDQFNLGFVDIGGWDTHVNQGAADGYLANRIGELGRGLALLATTLGDPGTTRWWWWSANSAALSARMATAPTTMAASTGSWAAGCAAAAWRDARWRSARPISSRTAIGRCSTIIAASIGGVLQKGYGLSPAQIATIFPSVEPVDLALI